MKLHQRTRSVSIDGSSLRMRRTPEGVIEMWGDDDVQLAAGMGFAHGMDRMLQMALVRLVAQGRLSECLRSDETNLGIDRFAREMGFAEIAQADAATLSGETQRFGDAYCRGVNSYLEEHGYPWEFRLLGYRPEPWTPADILATSLVMSYVNLAQTQEDLERWIIQSIQGGVDFDRLRRLFSPHLDGLTPEIVDWIRKVPIQRTLVPDRIRFLDAVPKMMASNNWVVAGNKTASGSPIHCHDPHLEINRLPAIWYEFIQHLPDDFRIGVNVPGIPGIIMGRTRRISCGFTYGFMDMVDFFIEEVRGGRCRRNGHYEPVQRREESIRRKGGSPLPIEIWRTSNGLLETPTDASGLEDGVYLCRAWSGIQGAAAQSFRALHGILSAQNVEDLHEILPDVSISCNWLITDIDGNIGLQQSGRLPLRKHSGLHPVPGWDESYAWQGFASGKELTRITNPPDGVLATANNDMQQAGKPLSINVPLPPYRAARARELLEQGDELTVEDMKRFQSDRYSRQAAAFLELLEPLLPDEPAAPLLREWDRCYTANSRAATLFDEIYRELLLRVFGRGLFGEEAWQYLSQETGLFVVFYSIFDRVLLGDDTSWFGSEGRETVLRQVLKDVLARFPNVESIPPLEEGRRVVMTHILFQGSLPRFLGFDRGPLVLEGSPATLVQGSVYRAGGRATSFAPSYRMISDMSESRVHSALAGGPSDRRFSSYYASDLARWKNYAYKVLEDS